MHGLQLVRPGPEHLAAYEAALRRGWSADNLRGAAAAREELERIATDAAGFLARMDDPAAIAGPVTLPNGSTVPRLPSLRRWMWLPGPDGGQFAGSIGLRWVCGSGGVVRISECCDRGETEVQFPVWQAVRDHRGLGQ